MAGAQECAASPDWNREDLQPLPGADDSANVGGKETKLNQANQRIIGLLDFWMNGKEVDASLLIHPPSINPFILLARPSVVKQFVIPLPSLISP